MSEGTLVAATVVADESSPAEAATAEPVSAAERSLSDVLAEVMEVDEVAVTSDFFADLGADSLVMAHFCARLAKRPDLPSVSIKEVYSHPSIRGLAASLADAESDPGHTPELEPSRSRENGSPPVGSGQYILCGFLQLLTLLEFTYLAAFVFGRGYHWVSAGSGFNSIYLRSAVFAGGLVVGMSVIPIAAKWILIGRLKPGQFRIWSMQYYVFWLVKIVVQSSPLVRFVGSPIYLLYLRALGAKIGRGVVLLSRLSPVSADLITIGDNAIVRKDSLITGYRAHAGMIQTGAVNLGKDSFVGEATVLDIDTSIGEGAQLGHSSSLHPGQSIPDGEHWVGSPASQPTTVDYRALDPGGRGVLRRVAYSTAQLLALFAFVLPAATAVPIVVINRGITLATQIGIEPLSLTEWAAYGEVLAVSLGLFFGVLVLRLLLAGVVARFFNLAVKEGKTYPLYGWRYGAHRAVTRLTNVGFFTRLFGDSSFILHYLRWLGYRVSFDEQTGANFGLNVKHDNPYHVTIGQGTMAADGLSIVNADYSSSSFRISPVAIGSHSFFGNNVIFPSGGNTGENCLHASKVMVPVEGEMRADVGFLGSPSFEIPRLVERDRKFAALKTGAERSRRLAAKNRHNAVTAALFLVSRWVPFIWVALLLLGVGDLIERFGTASIAAALLLTPAAGALYYILVDRASTGFKSLRPLYCSMYDHESFKIERYWKLSWQPAVLNGTPFKSILWRLLGVRLGKRLFDDGCLMIEKTMITVGDQCVLNVGSVIQPHSQEDGAFKSDHVSLGDGCTLGVGTLVHYGVKMGDGATLAADAFLMKGTEVPPHTYWAENPARQIDTGRTAVSAAIDTSEGTNPMSDQVKVTVEVEAVVEDSRDYWCDVLLSGGLAAIPRWTRDIDRHEVVVAADLIASLRGLAEDLGVSLSTVLLAAHTKVLAALAGEEEVTTGYVSSVGGRPLPLRLTMQPKSWRALLLETYRAESELLSHVDFAVEDLQRELGLPTAPFETVFEPVDGGGRDLPDDVQLSVGFAQPAGDHLLRLRYRTEALDADSVERIAGYHLKALALMAADLEAEHRRQSLLSDEEFVFQIEGLAGPRRELPDHRFHELFEQRVRAHPDAIAAVHGEQRWTYRELNARANQLGRALLEWGLQSEGVVAVVTERNLDWMAAVLAIFKAGGVYLPIEPHFPADRIASTLARAECKLVLTEASSTTTLDQAIDSLSDVQIILKIDVGYGQEHPDHDLGIEVGPDQLAYIYFTSGSTGQPKGAMCEHQGMLNHLYAKIDDLGIGDGAVVAQIAPQCFDISLWQLVSGLLVGGRTLLVEQETILDPERFIDKIVGGEVAVMQVVPSYLEVLLSYLDQYPRDLPDLQCVSVTGEALTLELSQRWFEVKPDIKLANVYGLTETSDDTNHEVMDRAPVGGGVPLGPAVNNVHVYVVDENLSPVPLGAPGEIVFSGVCVGRGYINDPDRTALAYMADPHREGERLYRSGDFGRWRADGKLAFLGRRDAQVKIHGYRIEIGEIENAMLGLPEVRQSSVVLTERADGSQQLVAFYSGQELDTGDFQDRLGESLPSYMVPPVIHWREGLPLTDNGKIDRKTLTVLAGELNVVRSDVAAPSTPAEELVTTAWADVLGLSPDQVGRQDNFFDSGGTSLSAVELVIALDGDVSLKDLTRCPVLSDLAQLIDGGSAHHRELLQLLSDPQAGAAGALVCFPQAGGNAIGFSAMAKALRGSELAVYAVELPGHDVGVETEPFASMEDVVEQVVAEITALGLKRVMLWGQSSGSAFAMRTAWRLQDTAVAVQRVFLGAQLLGDVAERRAHMVELTERDDSELSAMLSAESGYGELKELDSKRASHVGAAYRHDCLSAHRYLIDAIEAPSTEKLGVPVTVVVAADDPSTARRSNGSVDWVLLAERVDLHELVGGGHHFVRTRPSEVADLVLDDGPLLEPQAAGPKLDVELQPGKPPLIQVDAGQDAMSWATEHKDVLLEAIAVYGSVQVRGLKFGDPSEVGAVAELLSGGLMTEKEAFASRAAYDGKVYSSSAWPPNQQMCMHHELSYTLDFPGLMFFACLDAPTDGGAIAIADSPTILNGLPADLVERFDREGWMLTRSYTDEIGLSIAEAFGTDDHASIESYCRVNAIDLEWRADGELRTRQRRRAVVDHPVTGERCWFNQIAFLNEWTMNPEVRQFMVDMYGRDGLPFNTRFGNGDPIDEDTVKTINETYEANTVRRDLHAGDLMIVDNIRTAHSREPYEGPREVVVAIANPVRLSGLPSTAELQV